MGKVLAREMIGHSDGLFMQVRSSLLHNFRFHDGWIVESVCRTGQLPTRAAWRFQLLPRFVANRDAVLEGSTCFSMPASKSDMVISRPFETVITVSIVRLCSPRSMPPMYVRCSPQ